MSIPIRYKLEKFLNYTTLDKFSILTNICEKLTSIKRDLENINLKRGYVISKNIFDSKEYPHISAIAEEFLTVNY